MWHASRISPGARSDLATSAQELLESASHSLILGTIVFSLIWYLGVAGFWTEEILRDSLPVTLLTVLFCALALRLLPKRFVAAQVVWQAGLVGAVTIGIYLFQRPEIALLYAFLPFTSTVTLGWSGAIVIETIVAFLMWGINRGVIVPSLPIPFWGGIVVCGAFGGAIGGVIVQTLFTTAHWSLRGYEKAWQKIEEAREQRLELKQVQSDLVLANQELARLSDRLKWMYRVAEEARQAKEAFVANVSHELRTPLNMIIGFSEMITQSPRVYGEAIPSALITDIAAIQRNSKHLAKLVNDVLDLSQVEAGRMALSKEWTSLQEIVEEAAQTVQALFESKKLYLDIETLPDLPPIFCDSTRIRQVVINLLSNAGRFTERGGVRIHIRRDKDQAVVSVRDTGPGIPPKEQERLFEPFQQLDSSIRRHHEGSGLGLSISKQFVEMHGGKMWLESTVGTGTTIYFSLPLDTAPMAAAGSENLRRWFSPYHPYDARTERSKAPVPTVIPRYVLLEKGTALQRQFGRYAQGAELVSASDIESALQELGRSPAQALIVNTPPLKDEPEPTDRLAHLPYGTPAMTCWLPGENEATKKLGVVRYLTKPITRNTLLSALEELGEGIERVLLVDDEPEVLQLFARMLSSAERRYRVLRAKNGQRALHLLRERKPDVILLDLIMPEMDGFGVLQTKSQDPSIRDIPAIVISSRDVTGAPIASSKLTITRSGGMSVRELVACIESVSEILSPSARADGPKPPERSAG